MVWSRSPWHWAASQPRIIQINIFSKLWGAASFLPDFSYLILSNGISKPNLPLVYGHVSLCQGNSESGGLGGTSPRFSALPGSALRVTLGSHTPEVTLFFVCLLAWPCSIQGLHSPAGTEPLLPALLGAWVITAQPPGKSRGCISLSLLSYFAFSTRRPSPLGTH